MTITAVTASTTTTTNVSTIEAEELVIKETWTTCRVPENSWAKRIYYLNCVNSVIKLNILEIMINICTYHLMTKIIYYC